MRKVKILLIGLIVMLVVVGCDKNEEKDIEISSTTHYIDTSESVNIKTFNGYRVTNSETIPYLDGSYRVILDFKRLYE